MSLLLCFILFDMNLDVRVMIRVLGFRNINASNNKLVTIPSELFNFLPETYFKPGTKELKDGSTPTENTVFAKPVEVILLGNPGIRVGLCTFEFCFRSPRCVGVIQPVDHCLSASIPLQQQQILPSRNSALLTPWTATMALN